MSRGPAGALLLLVALVACRGNASPEDCKAMTSRYLDLAVKETPRTATMSPAEVAAVRDVEQGLKRAVPAYRFVQDHCEAVTRAESSCALDADGTRAWEACVHLPDAR
ncbi:MAG TPA: hypothetical protein VGL81_18885 [Polyangiaceae bacterium]|jgi:hypothetical protein